jgi:hypothetical protein
VFDNAFATKNVRRENLASLSSFGIVNYVSSADTRGGVGLCDLQLLLPGAHSGLRLLSALTPDISTGVSATLDTDSEWVRDHKSSLGFF